MKKFDTIVRGVTGDYSTLADSNVVVITSGIARKPGMERNDLISTNAGVLNDFSQQVAMYAPDFVIILVSTP